RANDQEALIDRYLVRRLAAQRQALGGEPAPGTETVRYVTVGQRPPPAPSSSADDKAVANATMGDKWSTVCYDALNDPNLAHDLKEAAKQLGEPTVIATIVGMVIAFHIVGGLSAGLGYVLGAGLLIYFFGQQFFEFLDIVSDVNKAETKAELDAA